MRIRAYSYEPGTVNYPGVMIAPGQALPRVHMMICCPGATSLPRGKFMSSDHYEFIRIPLVFTQIVTENEFYTLLLISGAFSNFLLENLFQILKMSMRKTALAPGQLLRSVYMEKSCLGKAGYPVLDSG